MYQAIISVCGLVPTHSIWLVWYLLTLVESCSSYLLVALLYLFSVISVYHVRRDSEYVPLYNRCNNIDYSLFVYNSYTTYTIQSNLFIMSALVPHFLCHYTYLLLLYPVQLYWIQQYIEYLKCMVSEYSQ